MGLPSQPTSLIWNVLLTATDIPPPQPSSNNPISSSSPSQTHSFSPWRRLKSDLPFISLMLSLPLCPRVLWGWASPACVASLPCPNPSLSTSFYPRLGLLLCTQEVHGNCGGEHIGACVCGGGGGGGEHIGTCVVGGHFISKESNLLSLHEFQKQAASKQPCVSPPGKTWTALPREHKDWNRPSNQAGWGYVTQTASP